MKTNETSPRGPKASRGLFVKGLVPEEKAQAPGPRQVTTMMVGEETKDGDPGSRA
ncbi:hypothetical protein HUA74_41710 [Myxococcus sp. CA051A]|uniref:hypothetical protein n=1 Tax=Myxococcus TaxID=32 RepID=UPI00157B18A6|nr:MULTISPECIES: hypothetical protein [Myxococcus]NTX05616.1 hypothetical protein [Myxococcus sp. CA040A]NTX10242.1 hypothetical protein [Myxococcus sp. CA056]NTX37554.1 hypothetical protein [Myxococcus sp. CA033]NTX52883.1 hypothetical protein [Myxococcus sp. CA039A]NTX67186.1 hypothetical protein [Myxococcus sp. CA051A]